MDRKVLLINPKLPQRVTRLNVPLSLLYLGTWLSHRGYIVNILDAFNYKGDKQFYDRLGEELNDNILAVGLSVMTAQIASAIEISKYVKKSASSVPIIWGGVHPTLYPEQVIRSGYADFVVKGEGEITTLELLKAIEAKRINLITGLALRDGMGEIVVTGDREPMDINELYCPDLNLVEEVRLIGDIAEVDKRVLVGLPLLASRSCPYKCAFCCCPTLGIKYRVRRASLVLDDIAELLRQGVSHINFMDDDFFGNKRRLTEFVNGVIKRKLDFGWVSYARLSDLCSEHMSDALLNKVKQSGCRQLFLGVESGSQRVLDMIRKGTRVEDALNVAERLNRVGIDGVFSYITGFPGERADEIEETIKLSIKIAGLNNNFRTMGPFIYHPYAGSELYHKCVEYGLKEPRSLEGWIGVPDIGGGAMEAREYPMFTWVQYPMKALVRLNFYCWMAGLRVKWQWLTWLVRRVGAWRCKRMRFAFPIEMWAVRFVRSFGLDEKISKGKF